MLLLFSPGSASFSAALADTAAAADSLARSLVLARTLTDGAAAADALLSSRLRTLVDGAAAADTLTASRGPTRSLSDNAAASDSLVPDVPLQPRSLSDSAAAGDALARSNADVTRSPADGAAAADSLLAGRGILHALAEGAAAADALVVASGRVLVDLAAAADSLSSRLPRRVLVDGAAALDHALQVSSGRLLADSAAVADSLGAQAPLVLLQVGWTESLFGPGTHVSFEAVTGVGQWTFHDPRTLETYYFDLNPDIGKANADPPYQKNLVAAQGSTQLSAVGGALQFDQDQPMQGSFEGTIIDAAQYNAFRTWWLKDYPVVLTDDLGRSWSVYLTEFQAQRVRKAGNDIFHTYVIRFYFSDHVLTGGW